MTGWAGETLAATAVLVLAVMLLRTPVARLFGARAAYALWLAPAARLLVPPIPSAAPMPDMMIEFSRSVAPSQAAAAASPGLASWLIALWLGGAGLFLLFQAATHCRFAARVRRSGRRLGQEGSGPAMIESALVEGPIATGLFRRMIVVPPGFRRDLTPRQQALAIAHERLHHDRGDLWALAFSQLFLALHWFNPLAHLAHRMFRDDLEAACDAQLAQAFGDGDRCEYARAIVRCAASTGPRAACTLTTLEGLRRRLTMLNRNPSRIARGTGLALAAALVAGGAALTAPLSAQDKPKVEKIVEKKVIMHGDGHAKGEHKMARCEGETFEASAERGDAGDKQVTKIKLCAAKGESRAQFAASLEKAAEHIRSQGDMPEAAKAEILAKLESKIAQLRAQ